MEVLIKDKMRMYKFCLCDETVYLPDNNVVLRRFFHPSGILMNEIIDDKDKDGNIQKKNGTEAYFYENGSLSRITTFRNNKKDGIFKTLFESGNILEIIRAKNGKEQGKFLVFRENGGLLSYSNFEKGINNELSINTGRNGIIEDMIPYSKKNKVEGLYIHFREDGTVFCRRNFFKGREEGESRWLDEDGSTKEIKYYRDGRICDIDGNIIKRRSCKKA
jgi:antitoxin component YwqK of YwqJK toxin-antitoxin module